MRTYLLREARERAKLTQEQLAELAEVDQTTISRLETDPDPNPTMRTIKRLAKALKIAPSELRFSEPQPSGSVAEVDDRLGLHKTGEPPFERRTVANDRRKQPHGRRATNGLRTDRRNTTGRRASDTEGHR
jgi:transcriptional regulator with XRE-family HTH domain